eukprot:CAMPEP_0198153300 /NCGR_PEP_ID=MMETSP1443-20131203/63502_1 /TAXON_ID=186043 /ORGANISM="Entomoneis sp., Strain CCMP2396" /LENGTH=116 /DNA_ID=CAMNT_0043819585 /DNA_START=175 /DNA_END=522 /DNA_ORIENTATION=+
MANKIVWRFFFFFVRKNNNANTAAPTTVVLKLTISKASGGSVSISSTTVSSTQKPKRWAIRLPWADFMILVARSAGSITKATKFVHGSSRGYAELRPWVSFLFFLLGGAIPTTSLS